MKEENYYREKFISLAEDKIQEELKEIVRKDDVEQYERCHKNYGDALYKEFLDYRIFRSEMNHLFREAIDINTLHIISDSLLPYDEIEDFDYKAEYKRLFSRDRDTDFFIDQLALHLMGNESEGNLLVSYHYDYCNWRGVSLIPGSYHYFYYGINIRVLRLIVEQYVFEEDVVNTIHLKSKQSPGNSWRDLKFHRIFCQSKEYLSSFGSEDFILSNYNRLDDEGSMVITVSLSDILERSEIINYVSDNEYEMEEVKTLIYEFLQKRKLRTVVEINRSLYGSKEKDVLYMVEITKRDNDEVRFIMNREGQNERELLDMIESCSHNCVRSFPVEKVLECDNISPFFYFTDELFDSERITIGDIAFILEYEFGTNNCLTIDRNSLKYSIQNEPIVLSSVGGTCLTQIDRPVIFYDYQTGGILSCYPSMYWEEVYADPSYNMTPVATDFDVLSTRTDKDSILCRIGYQKPEIISTYFEELYPIHMPMSNEYLEALLLDPDTQRQVEAFKNIGWKRGDILKVRIPNRSKEEIETYVKESRKRFGNVKNDSTKCTNILAVGQEEFFNKLRDSWKDRNVKIEIYDSPDYVLCNLTKENQVVDAVVFDISRWKDGRNLVNLKNKLDENGIMFGLFVKDGSYKVDGLIENNGKLRYLIDEIDLNVQVFRLSSEEDMHLFIDKLIQQLGVKEDKFVMDSYGTALSVLDSCPDVQKDFKRILGSIHFPEHKDYRIDDPGPYYNSLRQVLESLCLFLKSKKCLPEEFISQMSNERGRINLGEAIKLLCGKVAKVQNNKFLVYGKGAVEGDWVIPPSYRMLLYPICEVGNNGSHPSTKSDPVQNSLFSLQGYALHLAEVLSNLQLPEQPKPVGEPFWGKIITNSEISNTVFKLFQKEDGVFYIEIGISDGEGGEQSVKCRVIGGNKYLEKGKTYTFKIFDRNTDNSTNIEFPIVAKIPVEKNDGKDPTSQEF